MLGTIRRHQTWLWFIIIAATIGSFVVLGPTNVRMGNVMGYIFGNKPAAYGTLGGQPISREALNSARNEILIDAFFRSQQWPNPNSMEVLRETYWRLLIIEKQKQMGIKVSDEAAAKFARRFVPPTPGAVDQFANSILKPQGIEFSDFENFVHHEVGLEQLIMSAGVCGKLVTPAEAEATYRLTHQQLETSLVLFSASNYLSSVPVLHEAVMQFYSNQVANYRVPEQVQVEYVKFPGTNYTAAALAMLTNLDKIVDANVEHMGTNLYHGTLTPADSREAIKRDIIRQASVVQARKAAGAFAETLDQTQPHTLATFTKLAATSNLTVMNTKPFDREYGPQEITVLPSFTQKAFSLAADDPFGGPIMADDGVYVLALVNRQASRTPEFKEIETKVTDDYRYASAYQLAQQTAIKFAGMLTNGLAAGKSFSVLCAQASLRSQALPLFSRDTRSLSEDIEERVNFRLLKEVAFSTPPGKASPPAAARDGAFIIYVEKQLPVDETKMKTDMPAYIAQMRETRQGEAFNQWFYFQLRQDPEFLQYINRNLSDEKSTVSRPKS